MASFSSYTVPTVILATTNNTKSKSKQFNTQANETHRFKVSNQTTSENSDKTLETSLETKNVNRRNMLVGLGSLFAIPILTSLPSAFAVPTTEKSVGTVKKAEDVEFPLKLNEIVRVLVKRPIINRTKKDKEKANEILVVNNIKFDGEKYVKFDVFVNDKDEIPASTPADSEFAGSFAQIPHGRSDEKMMMTSGVRFGLTELLEDIKAEDDEYVLVTLVPRTGCDDVTVSEIKIELVPF